MVTSTIDTKLMNYRKIRVDWSILGHKFGLSQCFGQRSGNFFPKTIHRKGNCNVWFIKNRTTYKMWLWFVTILWLFWHILIQYCKLLMPRPLKLSILGASCTIILSKDIDKYAFMCSSNFNETDVIKFVKHSNNNQMSHQWRWTNIRSTSTYLLSMKKIVTNQFVDWALILFPLLTILCRPFVTMKTLN